PLRGNQPLAGAGSAATGIPERAQVAAEAAPCTLLVSGIWPDRIGFRGSRLLLGAALTDPVCRAAPRPIREHGECRRPLSQCHKGVPRGVCGVGEPGSDPIASDGGERWPGNWKWGTSRSTWAPASTPLPCAWAI